MLTLQLVELVPIFLEIHGHAIHDDFVYGEVSPGSKNYLTIKFEIHNN